MTSPVLMVVDDDPGSLGTLAEVLRRRYDRDYAVITETSPPAALGRLRELQAADRPVALVIAAATMVTAPAAEFLAQARTTAPAAKRCSWCRGAARARPAYAFRCRWWLTGRRPRPSCAR